MLSIDNFGVVEEEVEKYIKHEEAWFLQQTMTIDKPGNLKESDLTCGSIQYSVIYTA